MKTYLDCVPCFVRQAVDASRMVTDDPAVHDHVLRETLRMASTMAFDDPPPVMGRRIHRLLKDAIGREDLYLDVKQRSNALALQVLPELRQQLADAGDPFRIAVRLAIAGNIIDFGCRSAIADDEIHSAVWAALSAPVDNDAIADLRQAVESATRILYLADNAGEIVFDRLLIEQLPVDRVTVVVRGGPIINDVTRDDAEVAGLTRLVEVIDNGADMPGTHLASCSAAFRERWDAADLIIAKGQGNFETLEGIDKHIFFLLKVKCPVIERHIDHTLDSLVVHEQRPDRVCNHKQPEGEPL